MRIEASMKGKDIGLLLKLVSLHKQEQDSDVDGGGKTLPVDSLDSYRVDSNNRESVNSDIFTNGKGDLAARYTARMLEATTGISKSQINLALNRCLDVGLAKNDRKLGVPRANTKALYNLIVHGLKYMFPVKPGELTRGIETAFAAPVLKDKLISAGELVMVWPDAKGSKKWQAVEPLFKSAVHAVRNDPEMYALLALVDAIRLGQPREANLAANLLKERLGIK